MRNLLDKLKDKLFVKSFTIGNASIIRLNPNKHHLFILRTKQTLSDEQYHALMNHAGMIADKFQKNSLSIATLDGGIELQIIEK